MLAPRLVVCLLLLAGCATPVPTAKETSFAPPTSQSSNAHGFTTITTVDTVHFGHPPELVTSANGSEERTPLGMVTNDADPTGMTPPAPRWSLLLGEDHHFSMVNATLWIDLEGTAAALPQSASCFWAFGVQATTPDGSLSFATGCAPEPPGAVSAGLRRLDVKADITAFDGLVAGTQIDLLVQVNGVLGPDAMVALLHGGTAHDSQATLPGLGLSASA